MRKQGTLTATMRSTTSKGTVTPVVTVRHIDKEDSFFNSFKYTVRLIGNRRMIRLLPEIFWTGISIAYWSGLVATIVARTVPEKPENEQIAASLYALSVLGVGEMLGSIFMGLVVDKISSKFGCLVNMINVVIVWAISFMQIQVNKDNALVYAFTFIWGFMDGAVNTHTTQILGFEFDTASDPFSVFTCIQAIGTVMFQLIQG